MWSAAGARPSPAAPPSPCAARPPAPRPRDRAARPPPPARPRSAARGGPAPAGDTACSDQPRWRSAAPPGAPPAGLPDTATPRGSFRPRRRSPDTPSESAPRGSRRPAPGAGGSRGGHTPHRLAVRDVSRDLAAGPWRTARPAGDPPDEPRPTAVSGARSLASGGHSPVAGDCSCAATGPSRAAGSRCRAPAAPTPREAVPGRWEAPQFEVGAISGRRTSRHRYAIIPKIVQVKILTFRPGTR